MVLRRIWNLPRASHTAVVHCTACLHSLFNQVLQCSYKLLCSAEKCPSDAVRAFLSNPLSSATPLLATMAGWTQMSQSLLRS